MTRSTAKLRAEAERESKRCKGDRKWRGKGSAKDVSDGREGIDR